MNLDILYNAEYRDDLKENKNKNQEMIKAAVSGIEEASYEIAAYQMSLDTKTSPIEKAYRLQEMQKIHEHLKNHIKVRDGIDCNSTEKTNEKINEIKNITGNQKVSDEFSKRKFEQEYGVRGKME